MFHDEKHLATCGITSLPSTRGGCIVQRKPDGGIIVTHTTMESGAHMIYWRINFDAKGRFMQGWQNTFDGKWQPFSNSNTDRHIMLNLLVMELLCALDMPWDEIV